MDYLSHYRRLYEVLGFPLTAESAFSADALAFAEFRWRCRIPAALRDYYAVCGREERFNRAAHQLWPLDQCRVEENRLIFMLGSECLVLWSVPVGPAAGDDPAVYRTGNGKPYRWEQVCDSCRDFLTMQLHYQAARCGMPHFGKARAPRDIEARLQKSGWERRGEAIDLIAWGRPNQVICLQNVVNVELDEELIAGGKTAADLAAIQRDLQIVLAD